jgi:high-affinity iron transporter
MNAIQNQFSSLLPATSIEAPPLKRLSVTIKATLCFIGILAIASLIWAGVSAAGSPDPTTEGTTPVTAFFDIVVLVFREGLECVLVLAALTAGINSSTTQVHRAITSGVIVGLLLTLGTWFVAIGIIDKLTENFTALQLQAVTGLIAIIVLLLIMNWFFHKVYWGGWITMHTRRKKALLSETASGNKGNVGILFGLAALGFTSVYREGVEIVLFLQTYRLKWGGDVVLGGALIGLVLTVGVGVIAFVAQRRLPYRRMLVITGLLLGFVLLVSVGEQAQEMQLAHWIPTTTIPWLTPWTPAWSGVWISLFPTVETLAAQVLAAAIVIGSYFGARKLSSARSSVRLG